MRQETEGKLEVIDGTAIHSTRLAGNLGTVTCRVVHGRSGYFRRHYFVKMPIRERFCHRDPCRPEQLEELGGGGEAVHKVRMNNWTLLTLGVTVRFSYCPPPVPAVRAARIQSTHCSINYFCYVHVSATVIIEREKQANLRGCTL